jgi:methylenetetrahydrofolate dehydrogenase (NADP+)/methenyltetrahydrofolate cyclohydrolase
MMSSELVEELKRRLKTETKLMRERGIVPTLAVVQVGDDFSDAFVRGKRRDCAEVGIEFILHKFEPSVRELELVKLLQELGAKEEVHGIILQLPLPRHLNKQKILSNIVPIKDVDGLHPINVGRLWTGAYDLERDLLPCTPKGVIWLLEHFGIEISGKLAVIINRSDLVGKPLAKLLLDRDATVVICHSKTKRLAEIACQADLLVSAVGRRPEFTVTESMVKEGAVVVDVGLSRVEGKLVGDVDLERVSRKASHATPVPGGVGPVTRVALLHNLLIAAERQESK